jgi:hypothetical protein
MLTIALIVRVTIDESDFDTLIKELPKYGKIVT